MSKRTFIVFGLLVLVLAVVDPLARLPLQGGRARPATRRSPPNLKGGQSLFQTNCGTCHTLYSAGTDGNYGPEPRRTARPDRAADRAKRADDDQSDRRPRPERGRKRRRQLHHPGPDARRHPQRGADQRSRRIRRPHRRPRVEHLEPFGREAPQRPLGRGRATKRSRTLIQRTAPPRAVAAALTVAAIASSVFAAAAQAKPAKQAGKGTDVTVMSRNLYLGADLGAGDRIDLDRGVHRGQRRHPAAGRRDQLPGPGQRPGQGDPQHRSPTSSACRRSRCGERAALAGAGADQQTGTRPPSSTTSCTAAGQLNKGKKRYRAAIVQPEFDFEAPADANGVPGDGPGRRGSANAEVNGRLTMRDVILARVGAGRDDEEPESGDYSHLLVVESGRRPR